jgi:hypothetical protein
MYVKQTTVFVTEKREPELMARVNELGKKKGLKPSIALRMLLNENLPKVKAKKSGTAD